MTNMHRQFEDRLQHFLSEEEFNEVKKAIDIIKDKDEVKMVFTHDKEIFIAHLNLESIFSKLMPIKLPNDTPICFYSIFPSVDDDLIVTILSVKPIRNQALDKLIPHPFDFAHETQSVIVDDLDAERKKIHLQCSNVSHYTFFPNFLEIVCKNDLNVSEIHIAQALAIESRKNKSFFDVEILLSQPIEDEKLASIADDFRRYIQTRIKAMSIFDLVGPAMVGPSSSHTAGASRIGLLSRHIIEAVIESGELVKSIEVKLFASFRDTGVAHKTPHAIGGGLSGFATDDAELLAHGDPDFLKQNGFDIKGCKIDFCGYKKGSAEEEQEYAQQQGHNIAEIIFTSDKATHCITGFSIGGGSSANYPESVSETKWSWGSQTGSEDINGYNMVIVTFSQTGNLTYVTMQRLDYSSNLYRGTYTYSSGNGTMALENPDTHEPASATFSINGNTFTFKINGATYPLTKQ